MTTIIVAIITLISLLAVPAIVNSKKLPVVASGSDYIPYKPGELTDYFYDDDHFPWDDIPADGDEFFADCDDFNLPEWDDEPEQDEELSDVIAEIEHRAEVRASEDGVAEADWSKDLDDYFFAELHDYVDANEPMWDKLIKEYGELTGFSSPLEAKKLPPRDNDLLPFGSELTNEDLTPAPEDDDFVLPFVEDCDCVEFKIIKDWNPYWATTNDDLIRITKTVLIGEMGDRLVKCEWRTETDARCRYWLNGKSVGETEWKCDRWPQTCYYPEELERTIAQYEAKKMPEVEWACKKSASTLEDEAEAQRYEMAREFEENMLRQLAVEEGYSVLFRYDFINMENGLIWSNITREEVLPLLKAAKRLGRYYKINIRPEWKSNFPKAEYAEWLIEKTAEKYDEQEWIARMAEKYNSQLDDHGC